MLARYFGSGDRALFDRPDRLTRFAIERIDKGLLCRLEEPLYLTTIDRHVHKDRGRRRVVVPDVVVDHLVVPTSLTGVGIECDDTRAEQVVAGVEATVVIDRHAVGHDVDKTEFWISRHRCP